VRDYAIFFTRSLFAARPSFELPFFDSIRSIGGSLGSLHSRTLVRNEADWASNQFIDYSTGVEGFSLKTQNLTGFFSNQCEFHGRCFLLLLFSVSSVAKVWGSGQCCEAPSISVNFQHALSSLSSLLPFSSCISLFY